MTFLSLAEGQGGSVFLDLRKPLCPAQLQGLLKHVTVLLLFCASEKSLGVNAQNGSVGLSVRGKG